MKRDKNMVLVVEPFGAAFTASELRKTKRMLREEKVVICCGRVAYGGVLAIAHNMLINGQTVKAKVELAK